ncbi:sialic acid-binding Ig-like lectin 7 [Salarias fasciatus]|uniref:sialic acid-binding Ig-like lectin 7 n=1 Tax=Salarias fasciatus TaxID=181472 RepID=UPI0011769A2E|nr:sialic acid-binding Ig-like lectin 7 [Salarias fasciatus]
MSLNIMMRNILLSFLFVSRTLACSDDAELFITAPEKLEALSGSCLLIPCNFRTAGETQFDSSRTTFGVWIKNDKNFGPHPENVIFNSSRQDSGYPMEITGDLSKKNCTTLFHHLTTSYSHNYFFRVENWPYKATAICERLQINIEDSPPRPTLQVSGDQNELKEKESVTITCSAPTPCPHLPPRLTWSLQQDAHSQTEENTDGTLTTKIQQTITLSDQHDGFKLSCSAVYPVDGGELVKTAVAEFTLRVSYAPKDTSASISPSGLVSAGSWVNLTCSSRARPAVSYTWFKISDHGAVRVSEGDFYSFNVTEGGAYYCVAANDLGRQTSEQIHLLREADDQRFGLGVLVILKIVGIIALCSSVVIVECWLRMRFRDKPVKDSQEADYVNTVEESRAS